MSKLVDSILNTLKYSDHFDYPLKKNEIYSRLIKCSTTPKAFDRTLTSLTNSGQLGHKGSYYYLPGRGELLSTRRARHKVSQDKIATLTPLISKLAAVPGVLAIYLTGSLAVSNSHPSDVLDLIIITSPGRLWTTRLLLTLYTEFLGRRRRPQDGHSQNQLCLNLYLTPDSFLIPKNLHSLYTAYELIQAVPVYDPTRTHPLLLAANSWISDYLPNIRTLLNRNSRLQVEKGSPAGERRVLVVQTLLDSLAKLLESLAYHLQYQYMKGKITREHITRDSAFFHPHNPGKKVLKNLAL